MTEIEKVRVDFEARVTEAIAKIEELKRKIDSIGNDRRVIVRIEERGSRQSANRAQRDMRRAADDSERDWRGAFRRIQRDSDNALGNMIRTARRDGRRAGRDFGDGFRSEAHRGLGLAPGGKRADWGRLIGMTLPAIGPAAAGLALPVAGAFEMAMPAAFSTAAVAPFAVSAFRSVTQAVGKLSNAQNKYNAAASQTATDLKTNSAARKTLKSLMDQMTSQEKAATSVLGKQDVTWTSLTATQKVGVIQLRNTKDIYKDLTLSQKDSINALLAERKAWADINPEEAKAVRNYQKLTDQYGKLKQAVEPHLFLAFADAEQAITDAMRPAAPLLTQVVLGFDDLFKGLDRWFRSDDYARFLAMWSGDARRNIDSVGGAIGRIVLGLIHMYEAMHPLMKPSEDWLDRITKKFADWPTSPKGQVQFQHFMLDITTQGPLVWGTLKNIGHGFDIVIAALSGNPLPWQVLKDISKIMVWIASAPGGRVAINIAAWALAFDRLAKSLKGLVAMEGILGLVGRTGTTAAAGAAATTAGGLTMLSASQARSLGITSAGANLGESAAVGGAAGAASRISIPSLLSKLKSVAAVVAIGAAVAYGLNKWAHDWQKSNDDAAGVIRRGDDKLRAAGRIGTTSVSKSFQDLANSYGAGEKIVKPKVAGDVQTIVQGHRDYAKAISKGNKQVKDVMYLGRTQFGQSAGLFAHDFGQDVATMGASLKKQGHTLNQNLLTAMDALFVGVATKSRTGWKGMEASMAKGMDDFFTKQRSTTKSDYTALQKALRQYEDDATHGRMSRAKKDEEAFLKASQQYMDDSNKGLISTSSKNIKRLSKDLAQFMADLASGNSKSWAKDIKRLEKDTKGKFSSMADSIGAAASKKYDQEIAKAQTDIGKLSSKIAGNILGPLTGHAAGGPIVGPGTGTSDSILARLSNGEFVVNAHATARHRQLLEAINSNRFANGGHIGFGGEDVNRSFLLWKGWEAVMANKAKKPLNEASQYYAVAGGDTGAHSAVARAAQAYARSLLSSHGWGAGQMAPLIALWNQESGWNPYAVNKSSGAYGIPQSLGHGHVYNLGDYKAQVRWGENYIASRYGSPAAAWGHEKHFNWYDRGGPLPPGAWLAINGTGKTEHVYTAEQQDAILTRINELAGLGHEIHIHFDDPALRNLIRITAEPMIRDSEERQAFRAQHGRRM